MKILLLLLFALNAHASLVTISGTYDGPNLPANSLTVPGESFSITLDLIYGGSEIYDGRDEYTYFNNQGVNPYLNGPLSQTPSLASYKLGNGPFQLIPVLATLYLYQSVAPKPYPANDYTSLFIEYGPKSAPDDLSLYFPLNPLGIVTGDSTNGLISATRDQFGDTFSAYFSSDARLPEFQDSYSNPNSISRNITISSPPRPIPEMPSFVPMALALALAAVLSKFKRTNIING